MANFTFGNNGNPATPPIYDENGDVLVVGFPAAPSPAARIIDADGNVKIINPGQSIGLPIGCYVIEVVE
jgi:hypothetical protein